MRVQYKIDDNQKISIESLDSNGANVKTQQEVASGDAGAAKAQPSLFDSFLPFVVIIAAFYFLLIRPGQKKEKQRKEKINGVKKDDKVVTIGGIIGKVVLVEDDEVVLQVEDKMKIRLRKSAIADIGALNETPAKS